VRVAFTHFATAAGLCDALSGLARNLMRRKLRVVRTSVRVLVDDVAGAVLAQRSIPLHDEGRHPDRISCRHRVPGAGA
jgi:hypothetical protein